MKTQRLGDGELVRRVRAAVVSGIIHPRGAPARVLDLVLDGQAVVLHDGRILVEYRDVLTRKRLGLDAEVVGTWLDVVDALGEPLVPEPWSGSLLDESDRPFLEVARTGRADALLTGNARHFPTLPDASFAVVSPADLLSRWNG